MNYVLGGGVAGLVWALYHEDYTVIAEKPGGASASTYTIGPRYMHAGTWGLGLVARLGFDEGPARVVKSGVVATELSASSRDDYMLKTRGVMDDGDAHSADVHTAMASQHSVLTSPTLKQVVAGLIGELTKQGRVLQARVDAVNLDARKLVFKGGEWASYDRLVSTIPLPWFAKLASRQPPLPWGGEYVSIPVLFNHYGLRGDWPWPEYDYVYTPDLGLPFSRITLLEEPHGKYVCVEYPGVDASAPDAVRGFNSVDYLLKGFIKVPLTSCLSSVRFPLGRVVSRSVPEQARRALADSGVKLFGRFATWQDWILTHHLAQMAKSRTWENL